MQGNVAVSRREAPGERGGAKDTGNPEGGWQGEEGLERPGQAL